MADKSLKNKMEYLLQTITEELLEKIKSGDYDNKDVQNALKLLKDNNISVAVSVSPDTNLENFKIDPEDLPFEEAEVKF